MGHHRAPEERLLTAAAPVFGALRDRDAVAFRVMATRAGSVELVVHDGQSAGTHPLRPAGDGMWERRVPGVAAGNRYSYRLDGSGPLPDPASRFQPDGVHGPSQVVDPAGYRWNDAAWQGVGARDLVIYELHVGTFTSAGTFAGVRQRLGDLRDAGITAIELMPLADFPGSRNWGYDGVSLFAPSRAYGTPDDLRALVDDAHRHGIGVILDVVYNHVGPEGAYLTKFNPDYMTDRHATPWGKAINLDGPGSAVVRRFIIDNAIHWVREYHLDGLRLDATHAIIDDSPVHVITELALAARGAVRWPIHVFAEDSRNLCTILDEPGAGGWGLDGVWADDFHHIVRRLMAGDAHGYYEDFGGTAEELALTIHQGWLFTGQRSSHMNRPRGTDPSGVPMKKFVVCLQNHDQIGNRATGDRLHHNVDAASWRAASAVLLTCPMTPLLFMGQEWAASTPFQYFTDLEPGLGRAVTEGRRREFSAFPGFADPRTRDAIPDPQAVSTFEASRLRWEERTAADHAGTLSLYRALLHLRHAAPAMGASDELLADAWAADDGSLVMRRSHGADVYVIASRLRGSGAVWIGEAAAGRGAASVVLSTEDRAFTADPAPPDVRTAAVHFQRPGAVILRLS